MEDKGKTGALLKLLFGRLSYGDPVHVRNQVEEALPPKCNAAQFAERLKEVHGRAPVDALDAELDGK